MVEDAAARGRRRIPGGAVASFALHAALLAAFVVTISWTQKVKQKPEMHVVEVSLTPGDGDLPDVPKVAAPEKAAKPAVVPRASPAPATPDPVEASTKPAAQASSSSSAAAVAAAPSNPGGMIWTPPAPTPEPAAHALREVTSAASAPPTNMPTVTLGKGASDPVLVSFDEGRWTDQTSLSEARSLPSQGRMTMSVSVDDQGRVTHCDTVFGSGSASFDARGCHVVSGYVYQPARDASGKPHAAIVNEVLEWSRDGGGPSKIHPGMGAPPALTPPPQAVVQNTRLGTIK